MKIKKMEQKLEIYRKRAEFYSKQMEALKKDDLSDRNRELIGKYQNHIFATRVGKYRVGKLTSQLRKFCQFLKEINIKDDLDYITTDKIVALISYIEREKPLLRPATKADYNSVIKSFYLWLKKEDLRIYSPIESVRMERIKFYDYVQTINTSYKKQQIDPLSILTDEDIDLVIEKGARSIKDKTIIKLLHELGTRTGEFLGMRIGDIRFLETHAEVDVDGKTGKRKIFFVNSVPLLRQYLETHPFKDNPSAYLWTSDSNRTKDDPLLYEGLKKIISKCFKKSNCKKKHNPHWFRHSRASLLAPKLTEQILCKYMGWVQGTRQIRTYSHLSVKQVETAYLESIGMSKEEKEQVKPIKCICGTYNQPKERYCHTCFKPLKVEVVLQDKAMVDSEIGKTMQFFMEIAKNPEMMKAFEKFKETFKSEQKNE